jgi:hypothetical protein
MGCCLVLADVGTTHHGTDKQSAASNRSLSLDFELDS